MFMKANMCTDQGMYPQVLRLDGMNISDTEVEITHYHWQVKLEAQDPA